MDCEIIQINDNTWRIEDGGVRLFLLTGSERALLIDSGMKLETARDVASGLTKLPLSLLNTHADRDHIGSNEQFDQFYMHPAEEPVYRRSGKAGTVIPVNEGDVIDLGGRELRIIHPARAYPRQHGGAGREKPRADQRRPHTGPRAHIHDGRAPQYEGLHSEP